MFKIALATINLVTFLMGSAIHTPTEIAPTHGIYPQCMQVCEFIEETDEVICVDSNGNLWSYYGIEDYFVGDLVAVIFDDNGTPESIYDDIVIDVRATGFAR